MISIPTLTENDDIAGKTVLLRCSFNVPIENGEIENDFRIKSNLPTIAWLTARGAKVILIGHIWGDELTSLEVVHEYLQEHIDCEFVREYAGGEAHDVVEAMADGEVLLFENLRLHEGEQANDEEFAKQLAEYADLYVNDAFPVSHREHASVVGLPRLLPGFAGKQFIDEVEHLSRVLDPERPFVFVIGGVKYGTKLPLIEKFISIADSVFVGGALVHAFFVNKGYDLKESLVPEKEYDLSKSLASSKLNLPRDVIVKNGEEVEVREPQNLKDGDSIRDIGPKAVEDIKELLTDASMVLWNGPLGDYERGFDEATHAFADALAEAPAESIIGGGDTTAVVLEKDPEENFTFVSTAGGAMLQFLADETLPGITALQS